MTRHGRRRLGMVALGLALVVGSWEQHYEQRALWSANVRYQDAPTPEHRAALDAALEAKRAWETRARRQQAAITAACILVGLWFLLRKSRDPDVLSLASVDPDRQPVRQ